MTHKMMEVAIVLRAGKNTLNFYCSQGLERHSRDWVMVQCNFAKNIEGVLGNI